MGWERRWPTEETPASTLRSPLCLVPLQAALSCSGGVGWELHLFLGHPTFELRGHRLRQQETSKGGIFGPVEPR